MKKRLAALALTVLFCVLPAAAADVSAFTDVSGHWAEEHLTKLIEAGVIAGDGKGRAMPDRSVILSEMITMLEKSLGVYTPGVEVVYDPNPALLREDVLAYIRINFAFPSAPPYFRSKFTDFDTVSSGAGEAVLALEYAGMISGRRGRIAPQENITRAEFAALLSKAVCAFIDENTDFKGAELERAIIRRPGLTVKNLTAEYLHIFQNNGGATLEGCDLGTVYIGGGGGSGDVYIVGSNVTEIFNRNNIRIIADDDSVVEQIIPH
jgi:hypothetical protein